jgi:holliday junction DNA helicase RuvA
VISRVRGVLVHRGFDRVEIDTPGGVVYEVEVPLSLADRLPQVGDPIELRTVQLVREDSTALYGFIEPHERLLFQRLLSATGVGAKLALSMMSTFPARRLARALVERDLAALTRVSGVGKKTAERLALELGDRVRDLAVGGSETPGAAGGTPGAEDAVAALMALGMTLGDAERAVQRVVDGAAGATLPLEELLRRALTQGR